MPGSGLKAPWSSISPLPPRAKGLLRRHGLRKIAARGLDIVRDERMVREDMRAQEGPAVLAKRAATRSQELLDAGARFVTLDGVYSWSEDTYLRQTFGARYTSFAIVAPKAVRYERVVAKKTPSVSTFCQTDIIRRDREEIENIEKAAQSPLPLLSHERP